MSQGFTGKHMLMTMIGGFGVVIAVNLVMAREAVSTFGGVVVENSYVASQHFNRWLNEADKEKSLGWEIAVDRDASGMVRITPRNIPDGAVIRGDARHPLGRLPDRLLQFESDGSGHYVSKAPLPAGRWTIRVEISHGGDRWRTEESLL